MNSKYKPIQVYAPSRAHKKSETERFTENQPKFTEHQHRVLQYDSPLN